MRRDGESVPAEPHMVKVDDGPPRVFDLCNECKADSGFLTMIKYLTDYGSEPPPSKAPAAPVWRDDDDDDANRERAYCPIKGCSKAQTGYLTVQSLASHVRQVHDMTMSEARTGVRLPKNNLCLVPGCIDPKTGGPLGFTTPQGRGSHMMMAHNRMIKDGELVAVEPE